MKGKITLFEFPFNLGLTKKEHEIEPGVRKLPDWLKKLGFHERISPEHIYRLESPAYAMNFDQETGVKNPEQIVEYAKKQSELILKNSDKNTFNIILGGDCSILIGTAIALKKLGSFGLFYLDGHTDYIPARLSPSGGAAGMDLSIVCGLGHEKLTNIDNQKPYFLAENVFCVGNAETDDEEYVGEIINSKINYFDLYKVRKNGFRKTSEDFLALINEKNLDGFFIHFDVDVLNDKIMPCVDSRMEDGIDYDNLKEILQPLIHNEKCFGIEITILDPGYDPNGEYTLPFIENLIKIINNED